MSINQRTFKAVVNIAVENGLELIAASENKLKFGEVTLERWEKEWYAVGMVGVRDKSAARALKKAIRQLEIDEYMKEKEI